MLQHSEGDHMSCLIMTQDENDDHGNFHCYEKCANLLIATHIIVHRVHPVIIINLALKESLQ